MDSKIIFMDETTYKVLAFIFEEKQKDQTPSLKEIAEKVDYASPGGAHAALKRLEKGGYILRRQGKHRSTIILPKGFDLLEKNSF